MSFWFAAFLGFNFAIGMFFVETSWISIFKVNLPGVVIWGSFPILWIAETAFFLFSSEIIFTIGLCINFSLVFLTIFAHKIIEWIKKSKQ